jgi:hypothetical protein
MVVKLKLPVLEDANSIQIALLQVMRLLVAQQIDHKTASLLLYALQTASCNLRMTKFDPWRHDVVLDPRDVADTPLDAHTWSDEDFEDEEDDDEVETEAYRAAADAQAKAREPQEREDKLKQWAARQPEFELVRDEGTLTVKPILPLPNLKKLASTSKSEQIRAEISDMVRKQLVPAMAEKFSPGKQHDKEPEKKAT